MVQAIESESCIISNDSSQVVRDEVFEVTKLYAPRYVLFTNENCSFDTICHGGSLETSMVVSKHTKHAVQSYAS